MCIAYEVGKISLNKPRKNKSAFKRRTKRLQIYYRVFRLASIEQQGQN
jgi:hypothetical protein